MQNFLDAKLKGFTVLLDICKFERTYFYGETHPCCNVAPSRVERQNQFSWREERSFWLKPQPLQVKIRKVSHPPSLFCLFNSRGCYVTTWVWVKSVTTSVKYDCYYLSGCIVICIAIIIAIVIVICWFVILLILL